MLLGMSLGIAFGVARVLRLVRGLYQVCAPRGSIPICDFARLVSADLGQPAVRLPRAPPGPLPGCGGGGRAAEPRGVAAPGAEEGSHRQVRAMGMAG